MYAPAARHVHAILVELSAPGNIPLAQRCGTSARRRLAELRGRTGSDADPDPGSAASGRCLLTPDAPHTILYHARMHGALKPTHSRASAFTRALLGGQLPSAHSPSPFNSSTRPRGLGSVRVGSNHFPVRHQNLHMTTPLSGVSKRRSARRRQATAQWGSFVCS